MRFLLLFHCCSGLAAAVDAVVPRDASTVVQVTVVPAASCQQRQRQRQIICFWGCAFPSNGNDYFSKFSTLDQWICKMEPCGGIDSWTTHSCDLEDHFYLIGLNDCHWRWSSLWRGLIEIVPLVLTLKNGGCTDSEAVANLVLAYSLCICNISVLVSTHETTWAFVADQVFVCRLEQPQRLPVVHALWHLVCFLRCFL